MVYWFWRGLGLGAEYMFVDYFVSYEGLGFEVGGCRLRAPRINVGPAHALYHGLSLVVVALLASDPRSRLEPKLSLQRWGKSV